jgi:hypothetical protein
LFTNCVKDELVIAKFPTLLFILSSQVNSNPFVPNKLPDDDTVILYVDPGIYPLIGIFVVISAPSPGPASE